MSVNESFTKYRTFPNLPDDYWTLEGGRKWRRSRQKLQSLSPAINTPISKETARRLLKANREEIARLRLKSKSLKQNLISTPPLRGNKGGKEGRK